MARIFVKYDVLSAPVVEADGTLVGRIATDAIMDIIRYGRAVVIIARFVAVLRQLNGIVAGTAKMS